MSRLFPAQPFQVIRLYSLPGSICFLSKLASSHARAGKRNRSSGTAVKWSKWHYLFPPSSGLGSCPAWNAGNSTILRQQSQVPFADIARQTTPPKKSDTVSSPILVARAVPVPARGNLPTLMIHRKELRCLRG